jgi:hypothetical protein
MRRRRHILPVETDDAIERLARGPPGNGMPAAPKAAAALSRPAPRPRWPNYQKEACSAHGWGTENPMALEGAKAAPGGGVRQDQAAVRRRRRSARLGHGRDRAVLRRADDDPLPGGVLTDCCATTPGRARSALGSPGRNGSSRRSACSATIALRQPAGARGDQLRLDASSSSDLVRTVGDEVLAERLTGQHSSAAVRACVATPLRPAGLARATSPRRRSRAASRAASSSDCAGCRAGLLARPSWTRRPPGSPESGLARPERTVSPCDRLPPRGRCLRTVAAGAARQMTPRSRQKVPRLASVLAVHRRRIQERSHQNEPVAIPMG